MHLLGVMHIVSHLLGNHVNRVLDAAVGNDWNDGSINDAEVVDAKHLELGVDRAMLNVLAETRSAAGIYKSK